MDDLLTASEIQDLLKIDRTTLYRMLKDGRLAGSKVGRQWRFPRKAVETLLSGRPAAEQSLSAPPSELPLHCIQAIQDVFANLAGVGALTTAPDGSALTRISSGCRFCALIQSSPSGQAACRAEWASLAARSQAAPHAAICHAGLSYLYGRIDIAGRPAAMLVGGQFRTPESQIDTADLAARTGLAEPDLAAALTDVRVHDADSSAQIGEGLRKVAETFATIAEERTAMLDRLRHIAALSAFGEA